MADQKTKVSSGRIATRQVTIVVGTGLCVAILIAGCRHDSIDGLTLDAGDAIAANKAVHTIDPWPPGAFLRHQATDGKRIADAHERYRAKPPAPAAGTTSAQSTN